MEGNKSHSSVIRVKQEAIPEEESGDVVTGTVLQDKVGERDLEFSVLSHNRHPSKSYGHIPI